MEQTRIFNRNYILLMIINTLLFISFNMINPVLPQYVTGMGMSMTLAGILSGCFSITALICRPLSGMAADRMTPKRMYLVAGFIMTFACAGYIICGGFASLLAVRILHGAFFSVDTTVSLVLVTSFIPRDKMGQGIGLFGIGPIIAISFAPGMGLKLSAAYGCEISFLIAAVMAFMATACMLLIRQEKAETAVDAVEAEPRDTGKRRKSVNIRQFIAVEVVLYALLSGLFSFANSIEYTFMSLYSQSKGIEDISIYFTVSAVFILISRLFAGRLYDRKGLAIVLIPAFALAAGSMFLLGSATGLLLFLVAAALKALGQGAGQPSLQTQCMASVEKSRMGIASSTYYLGPDIMQGLGPVVGGVVIDHAGYEMVYYLCGGLLVLGMAVFWICRTNGTAQGVCDRRNERSEC